MTADTARRAASLNPRELAAAPLLRAIRDNPDANNTVLAEQSGRIRGNMSRDLANLEAAGWITRSPLALTAAGEVIVDLAPPPEPAPPQAGAPAAAAPATGIVGLLHAQILPSFRNPRRDWDSADAVEALEELAASIKAEGRVLQNLVVRPAKPYAADHIKVVDTDGRELPLFELVAGERRFRAVARLIAAGDWPQHRPIPALVTDLDDAGHDRVALIENLKRRDLKPLEEARAFKRLVDGGMKTAELAEIINTSQRLVQQRLQLLELDDKDQRRLEKGELTIEQARSKIANRPQAPDWTPRQWLIMAEVLDALRRQKKDTSNVFVQADALDDPDFKALKVSYAIYGPYSESEQGVQTGRQYLSLAYGVKERIRAGEPDCDKNLPQLLTRLRVAVFGDKLAGRVDRDGFAITWLNGPFEPHADVQAKIAERKDAIQRQQDEARAVERKAAERGDNAQRLALQVQQRVRVFTPPPPLEDMFPAVLEQSGYPTPWTYRAAYTPKWIRRAILDAGGKEVLTGSHEPAAGQDARFRMIVLAVNAAAGLATPADIDPADDYKPLDRAAYEAAMLAAVLKGEPDREPEAAKAACAAAVDAWLTDKAIEFGDPAYGWTKEAAVEFAGDFILGEAQAGDEEDDDYDGEFDEDDADDADEDEA